MTAKTAPRVTSVFIQNGKLDFPVIGLFILINLIVLINSTIHHPKIGYDTVHHLTYIQVLYDRLPTESDTSEYYSPPLPYVLPALFDKVCEVSADPQSYIPYGKGSYVVQTCRFWDGKFAQYLNFLISIAILYIVLLICDYVRPGNRFYKISALSLFSLLTVYYKTFSQVRPEPYVALFAIVSAYFILKLFDINGASRKPVIELGLSLGLLILSRQWGFFFYPAILLLGVWLFLQNRQAAVSLIKPIMISFVISAVVGGWFYLHFYLQYESVTEFYIKDSNPVSLSQFLSSARKTHIKDFELFNKPVRPHFDGDPTPIFYSDTWGDYWGYFTYIKENSPYGEQGLGNSDEMGAYLGRVNLFSLAPTAILGIGWFVAAVSIFKTRKPISIESISSALFFFIATASIAGFAVYLVNYFAYANNTLKASYMIQFFLAMVFLGADFLEIVRVRYRPLYILIIFALGIVFIHNLPAFITRYILFPWDY